MMYRIVFKNKLVYFKTNPRTGICEICGKSVHKGEIKRTHIHHILYHEENPLEDTVELCAKCHIHITWSEKYFPPDSSY